MMNLKNPPWNPDIVEDSELRQFWKRWNSCFNDMKKERVLRQCYFTQRNFIKKMRESKDQFFW